MRRAVGLADLGFHAVADELMVGRFRHDHLELIVQEFEFPEYCVVGVQSAIGGAYDLTYLLRIEVCNCLLGAGMGLLRTMEE